VKEGRTKWHTKRGRFMKPDLGIRATEVQPVESKLLKGQAGRTCNHGRERPQQKRIVGPYKDTESGEGRRTGLGERGVPEQVDATKLTTGIWGWGPKKVKGAQHTKGRDEKKERRIGKTTMQVG